MIKFSKGKNVTNKKLLLSSYPYRFSQFPWRYKYKSMGLEWWGIGLIVGSKRFNVEFISRVTKQNLQIK